MGRAQGSGDVSEIHYLLSTVLSLKFLSYNSVVSFPGVHYMAKSLWTPDAHICMLNIPFFMQFPLYCCTNL